MQEASQRLASVVLGLPGHAGTRCSIEAVIRPRIHVKLDRQPGAAQSIRIGHVFFEEEIKTADRNVGWRQARHIRCSCSRRIRRDVQSGLCSVIGEESGRIEVNARNLPQWRKDTSANLPSRQDRYLQSCSRLFKPFVAAFVLPRFPLSFRRDLDLKRGMSARRMFGKITVVGLGKSEKKRGA